MPEALGKATNRVQAVGRHRHLHRRTPIKTDQGGVEIPAAVGVCFTDWRPRRDAPSAVDDDVLTEADPTRFAQ